MTATPLGYFFLEQPPRVRIPIPHYRTIKDEGPESPSPELIDTIQLMQRRQIWMRESLIEHGNERLSYVNSVSHDEETIRVAQKIRDTLGFSIDWATQQPNWTQALNALREAMTDVGMLVVVNGVVENNTHRKLDPEEFRGFVLVDEYAPLIFVNNSDGKAAQMFTLAHELAHVFIGSSAVFDLRELQPADEPGEKACNKIAAEFLVPESVLRRTWPNIRRESSRLQILARNFKVSEVVVARRALDLTLIDREEFFEFYYRYQSEERRVAERRSSGGDFYNNQNMRVGKRFASAIIRAVREGNLLYSEAYKLTSLYGNTFDQYAEKLGLGRV